MSDFTLVVIFLIVAFLSLMVVSYVNSQQTRKRLINSKFDQLKRLASEIVELGSNIETLLESPVILKHINDEVIDIINKMRQLNPSSPFIDIGMENALHRKEELSDPSYKVATFRLMESDAAVARAQYGLNEAARIIRKRQAASFIEVAEMDMYIQELSWANLMIPVITLVGQGHKAVNRGDILRAHAFYKKALETATQGGYKDERQNQYISEIGEILNNKRKSLSIELMPETTYNPDKTD